MKRLKKICCLVWMTATLMHGYAQAQQPTVLNKPDSAAALLQKGIAGDKARLATPLKQMGMTGTDSASRNKLAGTAQSQFKGLLTTAKSPLQQLTGGVK